MQDRKEASSAFIIATRNRPDDLVKTVQSLAAQTVLPRELCIVDSSDGPVSAEAIEKICSEAGIPLEHVHPASKGLTVQRNIGIDRTSEDPVFLIDDDVWLAPDCHEEILAEYARWGDELGGVRAAPMDPARPHRASIAWRRLFGNGGWWPEASGKVRAGFYIEAFSESAGVRRTEAFTGYFMSFRRKVFEQERFDEALAGYGHKEDIDLSYRVSRHYVLLQTPKARCHHFLSSTSRLSSHEVRRMNIANQFYLHRKLMPQTARYRIALYWALFGDLMLNLGRAVRDGDPGLVTGIVVGVWEQLRGKGLVGPETAP